MVEGVLDVFDGVVGVSEVLEEVGAGLVPTISEGLDYFVTLSVRPNHSSQLFGSEASSRPPDILDRLPRAEVDGGGVGEGGRGAVVGSVHRWFGS